HLGVEIVLLLPDCRKRAMVAAFRAIRPEARGLLGQARPGGENGLRLREIERLFALHELCALACLPPDLLHQRFSVVDCVREDRGRAKCQCRGNEHGTDNHRVSPLVTSACMRRYEYYANTMANALFPRGDGHLAYSLEFTNA